MAKLKPTDLQELRTRYNAALSQYRALLMVCTGSGCNAKNSAKLTDTLEQKLRDRNLTEEVFVVPTGCHGLCSQGPSVIVLPEGIYYKKVSIKDLDEILESHLVQGNPVKRLLYLDPVAKKQVPHLRDIAFFSKQQLVALRNQGWIDPRRLDSYLATDGYEALKKVLLEMTPAAVVDEVVKSVLRGRGGGGFPTGLKWQRCVEAVSRTGKTPYLVCNADEGDPNAFTDRSIIETDPFSVLEGMTIGAYAIGATQGFIYIRKDSALALELLTQAVATAYEQGLLGDDILGSGFSFNVRIHRGAGAFICGESSALIATLEGRAAEPRAKYGHSIEQGYKGAPTVLNNVETWATIPTIIRKGASWFTSIGSGTGASEPLQGSSGTKVFSLGGKVVNAGLVEVSLGTTLREIVFDIGGGIPNKRKFKAVQIGGPSGGFVPDQFLDQPVDFDSLTKAGAIMGSGGLQIMDDYTCMVDKAKVCLEFLKEESCGKCTPCREGTIAAVELLTAITTGKATEKTLIDLQQICATMAAASFCQLGTTAPNPILSSLRYFYDEYLSHVRDKKCPAGVCKALIKFEITDACTGCQVCFKQCPTNAISGAPKQVHTIDQSKCIQCGICRDVCRFEAVTVK